MINSNVNVIASEELVLELLPGMLGFDEGPLVVEEGCVIFGLPLFEHFGESLSPERLAAALGVLKGREVVSRACQELIVVGRRRRQVHAWGGCHVLERRRRGEVFIE